MSKKQIAFNDYMGIIKQLALVLLVGLIVLAVSEMVVTAEPPHETYALIKWAIGGVFGANGVGIASYTMSQAAAERSEHYRHPNERGSVEYEGI
ncbi:hypothetical protein N9137_03260 [Pseudomonadales bacterium]|nr:hypothetical protein [Pseudomonadales bacterium]